MLNYSKKVLKHFRNPHNLGSIKNADGQSEVGNMACGDVMKLYLKVEDKVIKDIKFETYGCAAAIATSSVITDLVKGKTISEAMAMTNKSVIDSLDGLPPIKIHCSLLSVEALHEALYDYLTKNKMEVPLDLEAKHQRIVTLGKNEH
jgi:nitrogen fixation protein NifU and related proteins